MRPIPDHFRSLLRPIPRRAAWLGAAVAVLLPLAAAAESDIPASAQAAGGARVDLAAAAGNITVSPGAPLLIANPGRETARIELDLPRGQGIACAAPGEAAAKGRKFVVSAGGTLACDAPAASVDYRVFRGPGAESKGHIEVATVGSGNR